MWGNDNGSSLFSSDDWELRLECELDSAGIGMSVVAAFGLRVIEIGNEAFECACNCGLQQNVSLVQRRQERFSKRFPSSNEFAAFEKRDHFR